MVDISPEHANHRRGLNAPYLDYWSLGKSWKRAFSHL